MEVKEGLLDEVKDKEGSAQLKPAGPGAEAAVIRLQVPLHEYMTRPSKKGAFDRQSREMEVSLVRLEQRMSVGESPKMIWGHACEV